jgi:repressor LexA
MGELAEKLGISRPTVFEHIAALREKGLLAKSKGRVRSLRLTAQANRLLDAERHSEVVEPGRPRPIPLLGKVAAGVPIEAIENADTISLREMFGGSDNIFALEVAGDSMIDEGICSGDYVICQKAQTAENGRMVVAIVDDSGATLKRFYKEPTHARLVPANDAYEPIYSDNCRIEAVVLGLLRRL